MATDVWPSCFRAGRMSPVHQVVELLSGRTYFPFGRSRRLPQSVRFRLIPPDFNAYALRRTGRASAEESRPAACAQDQSAADPVHLSGRRLDHREQALPRHHLLHLRKEALPLGHSLLAPAFRFCTVDLPFRRRGTAPRASFYSVPGRVSKDCRAELISVSPVKRDRGSRGDAADENCRPFMPSASFQN